MVGVDPSFWRTVTNLPRPQDRKNLKRFPATVIEVSGTAPTQKARVLMPGEETTERPFFPVRGSVALNESVFVEANASGLVVLGKPSGASSPPEVYRGATAPATPHSFLLWIDISASPAVVREWNGSAWQPTVRESYGFYAPATGGELSLIHI